MKAILTVILSLFVIIAFPQQKLIKKQSAYSVSGKKKKDKRLESYIIYNEQGQEIEKAGLIEGDDIEATVTNSNKWNCGDVLEVGTVQYTVYDLLSRKARKETWYLY